jgi:lipoprotein signal peptidase
MKENLSGMESLEIIEQMIKKAKNQFSEDGTLYLLWGWVILCCSLAHFIIDHFQLFSQPWAVWSVTWVVALYMLAFIRKRDNARRVKTYTEDILGKIWFTFVIMMLVIIFILQAYIPEFYRYNFMFILVCYAMPTFLSGFVLQFRPLIMGGALGNVIDRVRFGAVVDFIQWHAAGFYWPAFNIADSAITVGAVLLVFSTLTAKDKPKP